MYSGTSKGHIGIMSIVLCMEVVPILEVDLHRERPIRILVVLCKGVVIFIGGSTVFQYTEHPQSQGGHYIEVLLYVELHTYLIDH